MPRRGIPDFFSERGLSLTAEPPFPQSEGRGMKRRMFFAPPSSWGRGGACVACAGWGERSRRAPHPLPPSPRTREGELQRGGGRSCSFSPCGGRVVDRRSERGRSSPESGQRHPYAARWLPTRGALPAPSRNRRTAFHPSVVWRQSSRIINMAEVRHHAHVAPITNGSRNVR